MCALNSGLNPSDYSNDAIPKEENNSDNEQDKKPPAVEEPYTNITQEMKTKTAEFAMLKFSTAPEPVFGKKLCDGQILHAMACGMDCTVKLNLTRCGKYFLEQ